MRGLKGILTVLIGAPLLIWGLNVLFFPKNNVNESSVNAYINNSIEMELNVPKDTSVIVEMKTIFTGIETAFLRGKTKKIRYSKLTFYNVEYQKYFTLIIDYTKIYSYSALALGQTTIIRVNKEDFNSSNYGTKEMPIPIFMMNIPQYKNENSFMKDKITEQQYQNIVYYYLSYIIPKKEFKDRFGKE